MKLYSYFRYFCFCSMLLFALSVLTSCLDFGGSGDVTMSSSGGATSGNYGIAISKIQGGTLPSWIVDTDGKVYLKTSSIHLEGECTRGVSTVVATVNGAAVAESALCKTNGTFTWEKNVGSNVLASGVSYEILLEGVGVDSKLLPGAKATKIIIVDMTAPTAPALDPVSGCSLSSGTWVCNSSHVQVTGSWSGSEGVVSTQLPSGGSGTFPTTTTFAFDFDIDEGQTRTLDFTVKDKAGNTSGLSSLSVVFSPSTSVLASSVNTGGTVGFAGGPINSAPSMIGNVSSLSGQFYDLNSALPASQRVQLMIGPIAVGVQQLNP